MKIKKRIIIVLASIVALLSVVSVVFAAYTFKKEVANDIEVGQIKVDSKNFINYQNSSNTNYRVDMVAKVSGITYNTTTTYSTTTDSTFQSTKTYYVKGTYEKAIVNVGDSVTANTYYVDTNGNYSLTSDTLFQSGTTYYLKTSTDGYSVVSSVTIGATITGTYYTASSVHNSIATIGSVLDASSNSLTYSIDSTTKKKITITISDVDFVITVEKFNSDGLSEVSINQEGYSVTIDSDFKGFVILSDDLKENAKTLNQTTVICSATEQKQDSSSIYLNQLGLEFTFTNEIDVYVRIHIQDAWTLTKKYSTNTKKSYSIKDQIAGSSPFAVSDSDWYYDSVENTVYLKRVVNPSKDGNTYASQTFTFDVNEAYYYLSTSKSSVYTEYVDVEVSFTVDIVQANRAEDLWKVDLSTIME